MRAGAEEQNTRRGIAVGRAIFRFDHRQVRVRSDPEQAGEVVHDLGDLLAIAAGHLRSSPRK